MFLPLAIVFYSLINFIYSESLQELYDEVNDFINSSDLYEFPINNSDLLEITDPELYNYGTSDFIIVGAGSSGCVLANRLSEISHWSVLLLEAGTKGNNVTDIPDMMVYSLRSTYNWGYNTTPQQSSCLGMENRQCFYPQGKGEGGDTLINNMIYTRGNPDDYDQWENGWSYEKVLPYFKKSENADIPEADPEYHGLNGSLHVNNTTPPSSIERTFLEAATYNMGLDILDYNGAKQIGVSRLQTTINFNKRQDAGSVFIEPVKKRSNLEISLNSFVIKIIVKHGKASGVEFVKEGRRFVAYAEKEIIIAAGVINSVQLLLLSGIGPKNDLKKLGIKVKNNLPVGESLAEHPAFIGLTFSTKARSKLPSLLEMLQAYLNAEAPLTRCFGAESVGFVNVNNTSSSVPNIQFITFPQPRVDNIKLLYNLNEQNADAFSRLDPEVLAHVMVILLDPKSRGKVSLISNSPMDHPHIDLGLLSDQDNSDIKTLYKGILYVIEYFTGKAFGNIDSYISFQSKFCEPYGLFSENYWLCTLRQLTVPFYDGTGTTRMGTDKKMSVVNSELLVHNMNNIRVAGRGIIPKPMSGQPYAISLMIGEKLADIIKGYYGEL